MRVISGECVRVLCCTTVLDDHWLVLHIPFSRNNIAFALLLSQVVAEAGAEAGAGVLHAVPGADPNGAARAAGRQRDAGVHTIWVSTHTRVRG